MTIDEVIKILRLTKSTVFPDRKFLDDLDRAIELLEQSKQRWIPCEKGLPEEETYVLISKKISPLSGKKWCVTVAGRFIDGRSRRVEWRDIGFGRIYDDDVLAWMPLPEPWRGEHDG